MFLICYDSFIFFGYNIVDFYEMIIMIMINVKMLILFLNSLFKCRMYKVSFFNFKFSMYGYGYFLDK